MKYKQMIVVLFFVSVFLTGCGKKEFLQLEKASTKTFARINSIEYGAIDLRLFDKQVPEIISNLINNIDNSAFENASVDTIVKDFCIVIDADEEKVKKDDKLEKEANELYPFYGAVCIPKDSASASSLLIVTADKDFIKELEALVNYKGITLSDYFYNAYGIRLTDKELDKYRENGGAPWISEHYTVIGQIYDGYDALKTLSDVETDADYIPTEDTFINNIEITKVD